jgi:phosphoenolpyruvate-protein kinase (PTS system EI component)
MIRLTPFAETVSGQELIKNERVAILITLIQDKFNLSTTGIESMRSALAQLDAETLTLLVRQILHIDTFEKLEHWVVAHTLQTAAQAGD